MALTTFNLLAAIKTVDHSPFFRHFGKLEIGNGNTGVCLSPEVFAKLTTPHFIMNRLPNTFALPLLEVLVDRLMWQEVMGQHFPLVPGSLQIENGVENLS